MDNKKEFEQPESSDSSIHLNYLVYRFCPRIEDIFSRVLKNNVLTIYGKDLNSRIAIQEDSIRSAISYFKHIRYGNETTVVGQDGIRPTFISVLKNWSTFAKKESRQGANHESYTLP